MQQRVLGSRGGRRKWATAAAFVGVMVLAAPLWLTLAGAAGPSPSGDINSYALYAIDHIDLKGGGGSGRSIISGGNVGAGTQAMYASGKEFSARGLSRVRLCDNERVVMDPGTQVTSPSAQIGANCEVYDLFVRRLVKSDKLPPTATLHGSFTAPDVRLPVVPKSSCNPRIVFSHFDMPSLPPGTYGDLLVSSHVKLRSGTYTFCSLGLKGGAVIETEPGTVINIVDALNLSNGQLGSVCGTRINVTGAAATVRLGRTNTVTGTIVAPFVDVDLGHSTTITGHVWSFAMHSDLGVNVNACPPTEPSSTTSTTTFTPPTE